MKKSASTERWILIAAVETSNLECTKVTVKGVHVAFHGAVDVGS